MRLRINNSTKSTAVTNAREPSDKVDATHAESAKKLVVRWDIDIKTVFIWRRAQRWTTALFELVSVQGICQQYIDIQKPIMQKSIETY